MTVQRVTRKAERKALGERARQLDTGPAVRCDPAAPYPDPDELDTLAKYLNIYASGDAWMAVRDDGVIKWVVADDDDYEPGGPVSELIAHVHATHGTAAGRVANPVLRRRFERLGHHVDATGWATFQSPESP